MKTNRYVIWLVAATLGAACSESKEPFESAEVTFPNPDAGIALAGTMTWPHGAGPFKAAVLISGTGRNTRDEEVEGHRVFQVLSDALVRAGIATLRYDKRGVGASGGDYATAASPDFASDARAALTYLHGQQRFSVSSAGLIGHSEGGMLAPMVADGKGDVSFLVLLAGPGIPGDALILAQSQAIATADGVPADEIEAGLVIERALYACFHETSDPTELDRKLRAVLASVGITGADADENVAAVNTPWWRFFVTYDPIPVLRRTRLPVLALNGSLDTQIPADLNLPPIRKALAEAGNAHATVEKMDGLNHLFQHAVTGSPEEYRGIQETMAPEALYRVATWIVAQP